MSRNRALVVLVLAFAVIAAIAWFRLPRVTGPLQCPDGGVRSLAADGTVGCAPGKPVRGGAAIAAGQKFDCNTATADEIALVEGIGPSLAADIVARRDAGFRSWAEIDAIPGVGEARLNALRAVCDIRVEDAGVW